MCPGSSEASLVGLRRVGCQFDSPFHYNSIQVEDFNGLLRLDSLIIGFTDLYGQWHIEGQTNIWPEVWWPFFQLRTPKGSIHPLDSQANVLE